MRRAFHGRFGVRLGLAVTFLMLGSFAWGQSNNECDEEGESPDVIVGDLTGTIRHGTVGGITAYSVGTTSCNVGKCWLKWISSNNEHPVIGQNMYRLKNGRFEQIGQSWLKHGFTALQQTFCSSTCMPSGTGTRLGVRCSDPYSASLNGTQTRLGPKFEVNAYTGFYPWEPTGYDDTGNSVFKRLQVHNTDLDPLLNTGATYYIEGQYVTADDALAGNGVNNVSYRQVAVTGSGSTFNINFLGATVQQLPALSVWKALEPTVFQTQVRVPDEGYYNVAGKATDLGDGYWHYEYAVHNLDSHRSGGSFSVPLPEGAHVRNTDFHDVDYHSGDPTVGTEWLRVVQTTPPAIAWYTEDFATNGNANALRWGTLYNFRFDADVPPATGTITLGLWRPGTPSSVSVTIVAPKVCDNDGTCDVGENCKYCPADCGAPGPGDQCCGNGVCQPSGEGPCACAADCGSPVPVENACANSQDDDCDGITDCADTDCCGAGTCLAFDSDGDLHPSACDCDDTDGQAWATPGESFGLTLWKDEANQSMLGWSPPAAPGGSAILYEILRTSDPSNFDAAAVCVASGDPSQPILMDLEDPPPDQVFHYAVRATNTCPAGDGPIGADSSGNPRTGRVCP